MGYLDTLSPEQRAWNKLSYEQQQKIPNPALAKSTTIANTVKSVTGATTPTTPYVPTAADLTVWSPPQSTPYVPTAADLTVWSPPQSTYNPPTINTAVPTGGVGTSSTNQSFLANASPLVPATTTIPSTPSIPSMPSIPSIPTIPTVPSVKSDNPNIGYPQNTMYDAPVASNPSQLTEAQIMERINAGIQAGLAGQKKDVPTNNTPSGLMELLKYFMDRDSANAKRLAEYQSPYGNDIANTLNQIRNFQMKQFDPNADQSLKIAQDQAKLQVINDMARRGRVFDTYTDTQMQQGAQRLIPQYEQLANQRQNDEYNRMVNTLSALTGAENQRFNQYQGGVGNNMAQNQFDLSKLLGLGGLASNVQNQGFNQGVTESNLTGTYKGEPTIQEQQRQFTNDLALQDQFLKKSIADAEQLGYYMPTWAQIDVPADIQKQLAPYSGNYAQFVNENPNSPLAQYAKALSVQKMFKDPKLLEQYGQQYKTEQAKQLSSSLQTQKLQQAGMQINNEIAKYNLDKVMPLEVEKAQVLIKAGRADLAAKEFENSKAPEKFKVEIARIYNDMAVSSQNAKTSKDRLDWEKNEKEVKPLTSVELTDAKNKMIAKIKGMSYDNAKKFVQDKELALISDFGPDGYNEIHDAALENLITDGIVKPKIVDKELKKLMSEFGGVN